MTFYQRYLELLKEALESINNYDGPLAKTLPTGDKAIDSDDAWLIIGGETGEPILRDKREQRIRERYKKEGKTYPEENSSDVYFLDGQTIGDLCKLADELNESKKE